MQRMRDSLVDVIGADQRNDDIEQVKGNSSKGSSGKLGESNLFEAVELSFAAGEGGPRVAGFGEGSVVCLLESRRDELCLMYEMVGGQARHTQRVVEATAVKSVLDAKTTTFTSRQNPSVTLTLTHHKSPGSKDSLDIIIKLTPSLIKLPIQLAILPLIACIADEADGEESRPEKDVVEGEDGTVIKEGSAEADDGGEEAEARGES